MRSHSRAYWGLCLSLFGALYGHPVAAAPIAPDAGQTLRELQPPPDLNPKQAEPLYLQPKEQTPASPSANDEQQITLKAIHVTGATVFPASELEAVVAYLIGTDRSFSELDTGVNHITAYYRQRGYVVARAFLPAQDIKDGALTIQVMEGVLGQIDLKNQSGVSDTVIKRYLSSIKIGAALQVAPVDKAIILINDSSGIGATRASLQPGASVGTTDLLIEIDPTKALTSSLELDNYGNRYTGEYRLGGAAYLHSPLKLGDLFSLRAMASNENMTYVRLAYQLPVGGNGMKLGGAYSQTGYGLGKEFAALQAHGTARSTSLYATYPFVRSHLSNLSSTLTFESKELVDRTEAPISSTNKQVQVINVGLAGNHQDLIWSAGLTSFDLALVAGKLKMDAVSLFTDKYSAKSNGDFSKITYNGNWLQRMTDNDTLSFTLSGQIASKNLNSSEKFSLGGVNGVRAYPQGEGSGDQGWMANLEVRHGWMEKLQGVAFYDVGSVDVNHTPFSATANSRNISGAGMGLNAQVLNLQIKSSVAWRISGGKSQSEPASINRNPRLWIQVGGQL